MNAPTHAAMRTFWATNPEGGYTCSDCGRVDSKAYVQPQHPFYADWQAGIARCCDCISARNRNAKAARKAALDAEPRCEVARCRRRGAWKLGGVLLCGGHTKRAKAGHAKVAASMGGLALFIPVDYDRTSILFWASAKEEV